MVVACGPAAAARDGLELVRHEGALGQRGTDVPRVQKPGATEAGGECVQRAIQAISAVLVTMLLGAAGRLRFEHHAAAPHVAHGVL